MIVIGRLSANLHVFFTKGAHTAFEIREYGALCGSYRFDGKFGVKILKNRFREQNYAR